MAVATIRTRQNLVTASNGRELSPNIWWDCPFQAFQELSTEGFSDGDDFNFQDVEDAVDTGGYQRYIDTGNTIRLAATTTTLFGGNNQLITDASDNDGPVICRVGANAASGALGPYLIGNSAGTSFALWFECRIKRASISDNITAFACGLGPISAAADNGLLEDDTGDIVDSISFIGFRAKHANGGTAGTNALIDFAYQDGGQTAPTVNIAGIATDVADTFIKLGFKYDPKAPADKKIKSYVNNIEQSTYITTALIDATAFPENDALAFVLGQKNGSAGAGTLTIDWWRCAQLFVSA